MAVLNITKDNFESEVLNSKQVVVVDFWASWCGPCRMLAPVLEELAQERDEIKICKINVDEEIDLARSFNIMTIPTIMIIKDGKVTNVSSGLKSKAEIMQMI